MVAAVRAGRGGPAHDASRPGSWAWGRVSRHAAVVVGVAAVVPWTMSATAYADRSAPDSGASTQTRPSSPPELSPVGDSKPPARHSRQVRASSNSSVAPSDTSSVDPVTDDTAVGTVSPTGDDSWALVELPAALDAVTALVGLDSHDHPWDEQPPPVVDLGEFAEVVPLPRSGHARHGASAGQATSSTHDGVIGKSEEGDRVSNRRTHIVTQSTFSSITGTSAASRLTGQRADTPSGVVVDR
jgi:hypothetical protein